MLKVSRSIFSSKRLRIQGAVAKSERSSTRPGETFSRSAFNLSPRCSGKVAVPPAQEFARSSLQFASASRGVSRPAPATTLLRLSEFCKCLLGGSVDWPHVRGRGVVPRSAKPFFSLVAACPRLAAACAYGNYRVGVANLFCNHEQVATQQRHFCLSLAPLL
jgi:hypothetical protein